MLIFSQLKIQGFYYIKWNYYKSHTDIIRYYQLLNEILMDIRFRDRYSLWLSVDINDKIFYWVKGTSADELFMIIIIEIKS